MSLNPEAYIAWEFLSKAISSSLGIRRYKSVTLAAAQGIGSSHCRLAHGKETLQIIDEEQFACHSQPGTSIMQACHRPRRP